MSGDVLANGRGDGTADQIHLADDFDTLLRFVIEFEYEAENVACVDETDNDDVSGVWNLVGEYRSTEACLHEVNGSAVSGSGVRVCLRSARGQRPEVAVVVAEDLQVDQTLQGKVYDRICPRSEALDPVPGVPLSRFCGDFLEDRIKGRISRFRSIQQDERVHIRVDTG